MPSRAYLEAEARRKAAREKAAANPQPIQPVKIPSYADARFTRGLVAFCVVGCWLAAGISVVVAGPFGIANWAAFVGFVMLVCFGVWGCVGITVLTLLMDIARDTCMTRAMTRRIMEAIEFQVRRDLGGGPRSSDQAPPLQGDRRREPPP